MSRDYIEKKRKSLIRHASTRRRWKKEKKGKGPRPLLSTEKKGKKKTSKGEKGGKASPLFHIDEERKKGKKKKGVELPGQTALRKGKGNKS